VGVNNKQRRAAKQRKRREQRQGSRGAGGAGRAQDWFGPGSADDDGAAAYAVVELHVTRCVRALLRRKVDDDELLARADSLVRAVLPQPRELVGLVLADLLVRQAAQVAQGGWGTADLEQLVTRNAGAREVAVLRALVSERRPPPFHTSEQLASGLAVAVLLASAPLLEEEGAAATARAKAGPAAEHPKLARVRALLAKAESTEFDEEAEALTAKAQELISRYALDRLTAQEPESRGDVAGVHVRRIWLDAPYVRAKASLVHEVASANRCRAATADHLGFTVVVGDEADLDSVELLVTSLLVQADTAMLREGRRVHRSGRSRTRSFRRSFLMAYAARIGERLREATAEAVAAEAGHAGDLLPVLRDHETAVSEAFDAMVPHTVGRSSAVTDGEGWAAGQMAADLALLDVHGKLRERTG